MLWWSDDLKTGITLIDEQHKSIFEKGNEVFRLGSNMDKNKFEKVIVFLMAYTNNHFMEEENLMINYKYEDLLEHRRQHNYFVEEIYKIYLKSIESIDQELLIDLKNLIIEWLSDHINVHDKKFIKEMNEKDKLQN